LGVAGLGGGDPFAGLRIIEQIPAATAPRAGQGWRTGQRG
jgi:hypothetical protein